jgi:hypothetical protein
MYKPTMTRKMAKNLCKRVLACSTLDEACDVIERAAKRSKGAWKPALLKLAGVRGGSAPYKIFTKGNSKLPFYSFSTLPEFTCPGAGECLKWCYSFTGWRHPEAFCRQLQNTMLLKWNKRAIAAEFNRLPGGTLRLYVDGDIDSMQTLAFWFRLLGTRLDIQAYGYSKSWEIFAEWNRQGLPWPSNYMLNVSSGSKYGDELKDEVVGLPITRGEFVAVDAGRQPKGFVRFQHPSYHRAVREAARQGGVTRVFSCPGTCGDCLPSGEHACGTMRLHNVIIAIAEHN